MLKPNDKVIITNKHCQFFGKEATVVSVGGFFTHPDIFKAKLSDSNIYMSLMPEEVVAA